MSPDGSRITANMYLKVFKNYLCLFETAKMTLLRSYGPYTWELNKVSMSYDGKYIAAADAFSALYLFNGVDGSTIWYTDPQSISFFDWVGISSDGNYIWTSGWGGAGDFVILFGRSSSTPLWSKEVSESGAICATSVEGNVFAMWDSVYSNLTVFDRTGTLLWQKCLSGPHSITVSSNGSYIGVGGGWYRRKITLFDKSGESIISQIGDCVAISDDGKTFAALSHCRLCALDTNSSAILWTYHFPNALSTVAVSANGDYTFAGGLNGIIYLFNRRMPLWNYSTGDSITSVAISSSGDYMVATDALGRL